MRGKRPMVSSEDQALFLAAVAGTSPLTGRDRVAVPPPPPAPVRVTELPPAVALTVDGTSERYTARRSGVSRAQVAELRGGKVRVEQALDLHGETVERGLVRLREFLSGAATARVRCVLVIHGKGLHSSSAGSPPPAAPPGFLLGHGGPLREAVFAALVGPLSGLVHALATAAPSDGGEGATYVMLRGPR